MKACLIIMTEPGMRGILRVEIWSSPEWEQSKPRQDVYTFVAYQVEGNDTYENLRDALIKYISNHRSRYHWLYLIYRSQCEAEERVRAAKTPARFMGQAGPAHTVADEIECYVGNLRRAVTEQMTTTYPLSLSATGLKAFIDTFTRQYFADPSA